MNTLKEYILEKLVIDKDVMTPKMKKDISVENILSSENEMSLTSTIIETIGYDDEIIYDTLDEWIKDNDIEEAVMYIDNKDYHSLENSGCPSIYLERFVVNDEVVDELWHKHYFEAKTKVNTQDIAYIIKTTSTLLFFSSSDIEYIIICKYK